MLSFKKTPLSIFFLFQIFRSLKTREIGAGQIDTHFQNSREIVDFKLFRETAKFS